MGALGLLKAYVLHTRRFRDSSLIVELLTREQGRVACIAQGALKARRGDARPQPFVPLRVNLRGRGEMQTITTAEAAGPAGVLSGRRLFCGLYLNELLVYLTARNDPCEGVFDDYEEALGQLQSGSEEEPVLRRFEVRLLRHLGHGLVLDIDDRGQPLDADTRYTYVFEAGVVARDSADSVRGSTLGALDSGEFGNPETLQEARRFMRRVINHYLEGRPLRSRELFR